jgi:cysteine desulfurase
VDRDGLLNLEALEASLSADTAVVSLHWANNETGVLFPIQTIAELCQDHGIPLHCDAVQAAGKEVIDTRRTPVNYLSISGHKFYAPKGIGALYVRADSPFAPLIHGGHQEAGRRGGTENLPLIVGLGAAAELAGKNLPTYGTRVQPLRNALEAQVLKQVAHTEVNGHGSQRVGNTTNIAFHGLKAVAMLNLLEQAGICASKGSACTSGVGGPSHVIKAMKPDGLTARQSLRFSLGLTSTQSEVDACVATLVKSAGRLRA